MGQNLANNNNFITLWKASMYLWFNRWTSEKRLEVAIRDLLSKKKTNPKMAYSRNLPKMAVMDYHGLAGMD